MSSRTFPRLSRFVISIKTISSEFGRNTASKSTPPKCSGTATVFHLILAIARTDSSSVFQEVFIRTLCRFMWTAAGATRVRQLIGMPIRCCVEYHLAYAKSVQIPHPRMHIFRHSSLPQQQRKLRQRWSTLEKRALFRMPIP